MYVANDHDQNLDIAREVVRNLRAARQAQGRGGLRDHEIHLLAILGGLPDTNGMALRQAAADAARNGQLSLFAIYRDAAVVGPGRVLGHPIAGSTLTAEEAYAHVATLGIEQSPDPISFHIPEGACPHRARVMIEHLQQLGVTPPVNPDVVWALMQGSTRLQPRYLEDHVRIPVNLPQQLIVGSPEVEWSFHVAPTVVVEGGKRLVIDPSLSWTRLAGPATVDAWHAAVSTPQGRQFRLVLPWADVPPGTTYLAPGNITLPRARAAMLQRMTGGPLNLLPGAVVFPSRLLPPL